MNPKISEADGERSYPSLASLPEAVDLVDVFGNAVYLDEVADEAIAAGARTVWAQLDVVSIDQEPERKALAAGMQVVSSRCIRTEHEWLGLAAKTRQPKERR